jgi:hypothetical protein
MRIDPRAWIAVTLAILALWLAAPREDSLLIPQRRRGPIEWIRWRLRRPARDRQEERDATRFFTSIREAGPPPYRVRQSDLPSLSRRYQGVLLADEDGAPPWEPAREPDPQERSQDQAQEAQEPAQAPAQEGPQEKAQEPLPPLRAWTPGDPGRAPTGVLTKITPEVERSLRPYLEGLPGYSDEAGQ